MKCKTCSRDVNVLVNGECYYCAGIPKEEDKINYKSFNDTVSHPSHYTHGGIECIEAIKAALTEEEFRGYCKGNILKYTWREKYKKGDEDLKKAKWYVTYILGGKNE